MASNTFHKNNFSFCSPQKLKILKCDYQGIPLLKLLSAKFKYFKSLRHLVQTLQFAMKFGTGIYDPQRMNSNAFDDTMTFLPVA